MWNEDNELHIVYNAKRNHRRIDILSILWICNWGTPGLSASIKDSVIKEIHQTQNIYHESRPLGTPEYQYENMCWLCWSLEVVWNAPEHSLSRDENKLGLSLKQSKEVEQHCLSLNKNAAAPLKSEETQNQRTTANISSGNSISKVTRQNRLPKWGILVGCVTL